MKYNAARTHKLATLLSLQSGVCPDLPKVLVSGHACTRQGWTLIRCAQLPHSEASYITSSLNPIPKSQAQQQINASPVWFHPWCWMALLETYHNVPRFHWCWLYLNTFDSLIVCMIKAHCHYSMATWTKPQKAYRLWPPGCFSPCNQQANPNSRHSLQ